MADKANWKEQMLRQIDDFKLDMRSPVKANVRSDEILKMQKQGISQTSENLMKSGVLTKFARRKLKLEAEHAGVLSPMQPSSSSGVPTTKFDCYNELSWLKVEVRRLEGEVRKLSTEKSVLLQEKSMWFTKFQEENKKWNGLLGDVKILKAKLTTEMNDFAYQRHALRTVEINAADRALHDVCKHQLPLNAVLPEITSGQKKLKAMETHAMLTSLVTTCRQAQVEFQDKLTSLIVEAEETYIRAHRLLPNEPGQQVGGEGSCSEDMAALQAMVDNVKQWTRNCCELACAANDYPHNAAGWSQQQQGTGTGDDADDLQASSGGGGAVDGAALRKTIAQLRSKNAELTKSLKAYTKRGFAFGPATSATTAGAASSGLAGSSGAFSSSAGASGAAGTAGHRAGSASGPGARRRASLAGNGATAATGAAKGRPPKTQGRGAGGGRGGAVSARSRARGDKKGEAAAGTGGNSSGGEIFDGNTEDETDADAELDGDDEDGPLYTGVEDYLDDISLVQLPPHEAAAAYERHHSNIQSMIEHATRGGRAEVGSGGAAGYYSSSSPGPDEHATNDHDGGAEEDDYLDDTASLAGTAAAKPPSAVAQQFLSLLTDPASPSMVFYSTVNQFLHDIVTENPLLADKAHQQLAEDIVRALYDDAAAIVGQMMFDTIVASLAPEDTDETDAAEYMAELEAAALEYLRSKLLLNDDTMLSFTTHAIYSAAVCPEITSLATMAVSYFYEKEVCRR